MVRGVCFVTMKSQYDVEGKWKGKYEEVKGTVVPIVQTRLRQRKRERKKMQVPVIDDYDKSRFQWWVLTPQINRADFDSCSCDRIAFDNLFFRNFGTRRYHDSKVNGETRYQLQKKWNCKTNVKGIDNLLICKTWGKWKK